MFGLKLVNVWLNSNDTYKNRIVFFIKVLYKMLIIGYM